MLLWPPHIKRESTDKEKRTRNDCRDLTEDRYLILSLREVPILRVLIFVGVSSLARSPTLKGSKDVVDDITELTVHHII